MTTVPEYEIWIRDRLYDRVTRLTDFASFSCIMRFNGVGSWELEVARNNDGSALMTTNGGIVVKLNDETIFSGMVTSREIGATTIQYSGVDDMALLNTPTRPTPALASGPYPDDYYVITDVASTVMYDLVNRNIGPLAPAGWKIAVLTLGTDSGIGGEITARTRIDRLSSYLAQLAVSPQAGGLGFRLVQSDVDPDTLEFSVYEPRDRSDSAVFTVETGTAADYTDTWEAPGANFVFVLGGDGFGNERTIIEAEDAAAVLEAGRRIVGIVDARGTTDLGELYQRAAEALTGASAARRISIVPQEAPSLTYRTHYDLGDVVTAVVDGVTYQEVIREIALEFDPDAGVRVTPTLGGPGMSNDDLTARHLASVEGRLENLEVNWGVPDNSITNSMMLTTERWYVGDLRTTLRSTAAPGWLVCNGAAVSRTTYADLFDEIGTTFGVGDGSTTFNLPDLSAKYLRGAGGGVGIGESGGSATADVPAHSHPHSHGGGTLAYSHTHPGGSHAHAHSHGLDPHDHDYSVDHDHAAYSSGAATDPIIGDGDVVIHEGGGSGITAAGMGHIHSNDPPNHDEANRETSEGHYVSGGADFSSTQSDTTATPGAYNTGGVNAGASWSGGTDSDSTEASGDTVDIEPPYFGVQVEIYTGVAA